MDIRVQDILVMKKAHPCGDKRWEVLRTGMDFRLRCLGCGHEVMLPRSKAEKNIRQVLRGSMTSCECAKDTRIRRTTGRNPGRDCDLFFAPAALYFVHGRANSKWEVMQ